MEPRNPVDPRDPVEPRRTSLDALELAVAQGMIGGDLAAHIDHARGFAGAYAEVAGAHAPDLVVDLGSGGGLPAFVLLDVWPTAEFVLVEGRTKRAELLSRGVRLMGVADRVTVHAGDAQAAMTAPAWQQQADLVTARAFASPPITAECAAHFLSDGAWAIVSEPPDAPDARDDRWPPGRLGPLGLDARSIEAAGHHYVALHKSAVTLAGPRARRPMERKPLP